MSAPRAEARTITVGLLALAPERAVADESALADRPPHPERPADPRAERARMGRTAGS